MSDKGKDYKEILESRGNNYGPAKEHFHCTLGMFNAWLARYGKTHLVTDTPEQSMLLHVVYMICDKLARASHDESLVDNMKDIQGYAELWIKEIEQGEQPMNTDERYNGTTEGTG